MPNNDQKQENVKVRKDATPILEFQKIQKLIITDLKNYPYQRGQRFIGKYKKEDIYKYLSMPENFMNQIQLRYISKYLYNTSTQYKRLVDYFPSLLTYDYIIEPYGLDLDKVDVKKFKKAYNNNVSMVESMNIKHEFEQIFRVACREDTYFGYIHMSDDSFFFQQLNPDYCKVSSIVDGTYAFAFDFNYFLTYPNRLYMYPEEFQQKYKAYQQDGTLRWQEISFENSICIKMNQDLDYSIPPFIGVLATLLDIEDFKDLQKQREEIGNYRLLIQQIPIRANSQNNNDYSITLNHARTFHDNIAGTLPEQVGLITSPMKIDEISFERDHPEINKAEEYAAQFWNESGVSNLLFSSGQQIANALDSSIKTDEAVAFSVLEQFQRWINRFLKVAMKGQYKFRVRMLRNTIFNQKDNFGNLIEAATYGAPVKMQMMATLGHLPSAVNNMAFLENEILGLTVKFEPLQSAHTQGGDGSGVSPRTGGRSSDSGRPEGTTKDNIDGNSS